MSKVSRDIVATSRACMLLAVALCGCAQVLGIEDWTESGSAGQGGLGGQQSASSGTGAQGGGVSASVGPGGAGTASSASAGTGGQGGTGTASSASAGTGGTGTASSASAGTGGTGAASSSSAGTGGQGTGGTVGVGEICDNGTDDDFDGQVDCADEECAGASYQCVPQAPAPWKGPVVVYVGDQNSPLPPCGEGWGNASDWLTGMLMPGNFQCGSCSCSPFMAGTCSLSAFTHVAVYNDSSCGSPTATTGVNIPNACTSINNPTTSLMYSAKLFGQAVPPGGWCVPVGGTPTQSQPYFAQRARICESASGAKGCMPGQVCTSPPPNQFNSKRCVYQTLNDSPPLTCPAPYSTPAMFFNGINDQRTCSPCQCGTPAGQCETTASIFSDGQCANLISDMGPGQCLILQQNMPGVPFTAKVDPGTSSGGSCPASTSIPMGEVEGTGRTQVCCMP